MDGWEAFARAEPEMAELGLALLHRRGDGEGLLATVAPNGTPRIHPLNVGVRDGRLLVFVQDHSAKARDLAENPHYALHAHLDAEEPHEFLIRGQARLVADPAVRAAAAADWFFTVSDAYPLYELLIEHVLLGERSSANDWPPRYRSWRSRSDGIQPWVTNGEREAASRVESGLSWSECTGGGKNRTPIQFILSVRYLTPKRRRVAERLAARQAGRSVERGLLHDGTRSVVCISRA